MEAVSILTTAGPIVEDGAMARHMDTVYVQDRKVKVNIRVHGSTVMNFPASTYG